MNTAKIYHDSDGDECNIFQVVRREPEWAAARVQEGEKAISELTELKAAWNDLVGNTPDADAFGNVTIAEIDYDAFHKLIAKH